MPLSNFIPRPNKRGAVFTTLMLIAMAMGLARLVPAKIPKDQAYWNYILAAGFCLVSLGSVRYMVEGAIDDAAKDISNEGLEEKVKQKTQEHQQATDAAIAKLAECERSLPAYAFSRQKKEYELAILRARHPRDFTVKVMEHPTLLDEAGREILARESITRGLAKEEKFLLGLSSASCMRAWGLKNATQNDHLTRNPKFTIFRQYIYVCIQAWLMKSIENDRFMDLAPILPNPADMQAFTLEDQVTALSYIKDKFIDLPSLDQYLAKEYRPTARAILKENLEHLISELVRQQSNDG